MLNMIQTVLISGNKSLSKQILVYIYKNVCVFVHEYELGGGMAANSRKEAKQCISVTFYFSSYSQIRHHTENLGASQNFFACACAFISQKN